MRRLGLSLALLVLVAGCAHYPANPKLAQYDQNAGYRYENLRPGPRNSDSLFVILTFSGGGTRAAALSYGVLEKLRDTHVTWEGQERSLLDEVDVISSVSGGSFTAAYYTLFRDKTFTQFPQRFLYRNIEGDLKRLLFNPSNWVKLASPDYGRIDMAADFYNREIFAGQHFSDLNKQDLRPYLMINATDMSAGAQFRFVQETFDMLCSDLTGVSVARAVAASSNFPVAFTPLTVNNYPNGCGYRSPVWVNNALNDADINPPRSARALLHESYVDEHEQNGQKIKDRPYLHLLDGGVADNIGLRGPLQSIMSNDMQWSILNKINNGQIKKLVVITVDARSQPDASYDQKASPPGLFTVLSTIATIPLDNYSQDTVELLRNEFAYRRQLRASWEACGTLLQRNACVTREMPGTGPSNTGLYNIYVGFSRIKDPTERHQLFNYPTSFSLTNGQVDKLRKVGADLLQDSPDFKQLIHGL